MPAATQAHAITPAPRKDDVSASLEQIVSRYAAVVRDAARRHGLCESDVDEIFQDVRIRLWRALSTGEKISAAPASYVYRTAVSAALDLIRRRRARREDHAEWLEDGVPAGVRFQPDQAVQADELVTRLARELTSLNDPRRVVVRMHLLGYHRCEIAEILGWTEAKTRNLLYRGLADLRTRLGNGRPFSEV